jgi:asparagine synthase (glutamine-hydrolysing)
MCGIYGALGDISTVDIDKVHQDLYHRGPDSQGSKEFERILFIHNRLSIIDLDTEANQPMEFDDVIIVFNGEIYNYQSLIREFNLNVQTQSDTEVIIRLYKKLGISFIKELNGMFAIALYDKKIKKTYLIRDRFGKKPLFYTKYCNTVYFSSEVKTIINQIKSKEINDQSIYDFLTLLSPSLENSFFKDIYKLQAGHYIEIDQKLNFNKEKYFDITQVFKQKELSFNSIVSKTDKLLESSIKLRLQSERKVAIALSGGLDSSLNLYYANKFNKDIYAINITYKGFKNSESEIAKKYAKELGVKLIQLEIGNEEYLNAFKELSGFIDTPIIWIDMILVYLMCKKLKEYDIRVLLVGEGGDELGAYESYFINIDIYKKFIEDKDQYIDISKKKPEKFDIVFENDLISKRHIHGFYENEKKDYLKQHSSSYQTLYDLMKGTERFIEKILTIEYKLRIPELLLARLDYASMQNSVEIRSPFLDKELVEFTLSTKFENRNPKNNKKAVIKQLAKQYLPSYIYNASKKGFGYEFESFLNGELKEEYIKTILNNDNAYIKQYLPHQFLEQDHKGYRVWMLYSLNNWLEKVSNV